MKDNDRDEKCRDDYGEEGNGGNEAEGADIAGMSLSEDQRQKREAHVTHIGLGAEAQGGKEDPAAAKAVGIRLAVAPAQDALLHHEVQE